MYSKSSVASYFNETGSKFGDSYKLDHKLEKLSRERLEIVNFLNIKFISYPFSTKPNNTSCRKEFISGLKSTGAVSIVV